MASYKGITPESLREAVDAKNWFLHIWEVCFDSIEELFICTSLVCYLTKAQKKKNPDMNCITLLSKIYKSKEELEPNCEQYNYKMQDFLYKYGYFCEQCFVISNNFSNFGITKATAMVAKINEIINKNFSKTKPLDE